MDLTKEEQKMLEGKHGKAVKKSMEILTTLGDIYGAKKMIDVISVQIAGVSYSNLGEAGLEYLDEIADLKTSHYIRKAVTPPPELIIALAAPIYWFTKGFFTKAGEKTGEMLGIEIVNAYELLKEKLIDLSHFLTHILI